MELLDGLEEKTIIFCKFQSEIDDITNIINSKYGKDTAVPFTGDLTQKKRQNNLDLFQTTSQYLVANKQCGAYGLNLQFCSYIIFYSNDWNYGTRSQAEDRVHRIGQTENVHIVDICAADTLDERILKCLDKKENLVDSIREEIEKNKDKEDKLYSWITKKDWRKRKYSLKIKNKDKEDLYENL